MKNIIDYIKESQEFVYAVIDKDLDGAIMSVWNTKDEAEKEIANCLKENDHSKLEIKQIKRSEVEKS